MCDGCSSLSSLPNFPNMNFSLLNSPKENENSNNKNLNISNFSLSSNSSLFNRILKNNNNDEFNDSIILSSLSDSYCDSNNSLNRANISLSFSKGSISV